jgi:hypothetical protein
MSRTIRLSVTVLVLVCLTAGAAQAWPIAQVRLDLGLPEAAERLEAVWEWLASIFQREEPASPNPTPSGAQEKDGCSHDPNGKPPCGG